MSTLAPALNTIGGCVVISFQSIAQVRAVYGDAEAKTLIENCGNKQTEKAVLPSEIMQLPDFKWYLKVATYPYWMNVRFDYLHFKMVTAPYWPVDGGIKAYAPMPHAP